MVLAEVRFLGRVQTIIHLKVKIMTTEIYKGVTIRKYGECIGEGVYPICFTDDLENTKERKAILHDCWQDARKYIDRIKG